MKLNSGSYGHAVKRIAPDVFQLSWVIDFKYPGSRLRYPRQFTRNTDFKGMLKFCQKWNIRFEYQNNPN